MQKRLFFVFFSLSFYCLTAQEIEDSTKSQIVFDSLSDLSSRQWLTDSLSVLAWGDSVRNGMTNKTSNDIAIINNKIDSLNKLKLPTDKLQHKIDSINQKKDQLLSTVTNKQQELLGDTKKKLTDWQTKLKSKLGLNMKDINSATTDMGGTPVSSGQLAVGSGMKLGNLNLSNEDLKIPSLGATDFQNLELPTDLKSINQSLPFSKIDGLQEWQGKITEVTGKVPSMDGIKNNPDKVIEGAVTNIGEVKDIKKVLNANALDQGEYGALLKNVNDEDAMKKMFTSQVKKEALNHFKGQEQMLQSAMDQVSKYKQKYATINSLSDIKDKKIPKNPLKGKPFQERFIPGFGLQIFSKDYVNLDVNPYGRYLVTDKISVGLGWNQRWAMNWKDKSFVAGARVYGPRAFTELKLKRGFAIRLEGEAINTYIPPYSLAPGEGKRTWLYTTMTGLKKEYRFIKNVKGYTIVQFDVIKLFVPNHHSTYGNVVNARLGFEFPMKKKTKK